MAGLFATAAPFTGAKVAWQQRTARPRHHSQPLTVRAASSAAVPIKDRGTWTGERACLRSSGMRFPLISAND